MGSPPWAFHTPTQRTISIPTQALAKRTLAGKAYDFNFIDPAFRLQKRIFLKSNRTAALRSCCAAVNFGSSCELAYDPFPAGLGAGGCAGSSVACSGFLAMRHRGLSQCSGVGGTFGDPDLMTRQLLGVAGSCW